MNLTERKSRLRTRMRALRDAVPEEERRRLASRIAERLLDLPQVRGAGTIMAFSSFGSEVAMAAVTQRLLADGKRLLLPYLDGSAMEAAVVEPDQPLDDSGYGPQEPALREAVDPGVIDLVIVPGLAFDRRGRRLGYGGAHYDRYLTRVRPDTARCGVAFGFQVVEEVPAGPGDVPVHLIVTEDETIDCR